MLNFEVTSDFIFLSPNAVTYYVVEAWDQDSKTTALQLSAVLQRIFFYI